MATHMSWSPFENGFFFDFSSCHRPLPNCPSAVDQPTVDWLTTNHQPIGWPAASWQESTFPAAVRRTYSGKKGIFGVPKGNPFFRQAEFSGEFGMPSKGPSVCRLRSQSDLIRRVNRGSHYLCTRWLLLIWGPYNNVHKRETNKMRGGDWYHTNKNSQTSASFVIRLDILWKCVGLVHSARQGIKPNNEHNKSQDQTSCESVLVLCIELGEGSS